jgi:hypothetical protein
MTIPKATWAGEFTVMGVSLRCYVLDDEARSRVINCDDIEKLLEVMKDLPGPTVQDEEELARFTRWQRGLDDTP